MEHLIHRSPSVGNLTKKIIAINPELQTSDIINIIRQCVLSQAQSPLAGEFIQAEVIDESKALRLAEATKASS
jgi:hypothetical protein